MKKLNSILLIDDNVDDNFFHVREIKKFNASIEVSTKNSALQALEHLQQLKENGEDFPNLLFLDINMPGMNGWEFLQEYNSNNQDSANAVVIIMLTTSSNPDDEAKAKSWDIVTDYKTKPLTKELLEEIIEKYFDA